MILVTEDVYKVGDTWYDVQAEIIPSHKKFGRRWFVEIHSRPSLFPASLNKDKEESIWTHYHTHDFYAWTFRSAWKRAYDVTWDLTEYLMAKPEELPTR